jgi:hypothetical protein
MFSTVARPCEHPQDPRVTQNLEVVEIMIRLDHLAIPVRDCARSRDWYRNNLGLKVEFEIPQRKVVALQDARSRMGRQFIVYADISGR